ncbi:MAG: hypothetical protein JO034_30500 [Singulisphaera sp.]|nr:hypothetical protein [Singulisphaera sp.]
MDDLPKTLHEIPYRRLFPWVRLFRGIGVASDPKKLMLAALGLVLLHVGWAGLDRLFVASSRVTPAVLPSSRWPALAHWADEVGVADRGVDPEWLARRLGGAAWRLTEPARYLVGPFLEIFSAGGDGTTFPHALLAGVWGVVVWGLIGGAIARIAMVQAALSERVGMAAALRFAGRKWLPLIVAPLSPLVAVTVFAASCAAFGLLYRLPTALGPIVAGLFAFLPLLAGLVMALILILLAVGWPLMHATIAAEAEDGFDAVSRSFAYVHQRPGHYAAYVALAWAVGTIGLAFVEVFAGLVLHLTQWAVSFGAPRGLLSGLIRYDLPSTVVPLARDLHAFWLAVVRLLVHGWAYSYFWASAAVIYLLLRHDVDGTPWQTVALVGREAPAPAPPKVAPPPSPSTEGGTTAEEASAATS